MAVNFDIKVNGLAGLEQKLEKLPKSIQGKVVRSSLMSAALPIQKRARELAGSKVASRLEKGVVRKFIKPRSASKPRPKVDIGFSLKKGEEFFVLKFFEQGFTPKVGKGKGKKRATGTPVAARPMLKPAMRERSKQAVDIFAKRMGKRIEKEAKV